MSRSKPAPNTADLQQATDAMPDGPNVAPSAHEHEAAQGLGTTQAGAGEQQQQQQQDQVSPGGREQRIQQAAYALAAGRGFEPGHELDDWLEAERSIDGGSPAD